MFVSAVETLGSTRWQTRQQISTPMVALRSDLLFFVQQYMEEYVAPPQPPSPLVHPNLCSLELTNSYYFSSLSDSQ